ncbi:MAG TPA: glycosyl hydrolase 53 family protein [Candidatus Didemnitutus sp.]|nr:glycosyl hydrolase 53 family protein [Candidatus Didemnitutus sp.]
MLRMLAALLALGATFSLRAVAAEAPFAKGADVGWLSEMEAAGIKFRGTGNRPLDCLEVLKACGMNSIRLRVWVNPKDGWCGEADVVKMAVRAKHAGYRIMIDFHYSDWWADPGKQNKPAAWARHDIRQLKKDVAQHTTKVLTALKQAGVTPEWVQVGNETNDGMLWDDGRASKNMKNFAELVASGYHAVKAVFPEAKVIVHISNGYDSALFRWMFDGLKANDTPYDVIGMSLYPTALDWQKLNAQCLANMQDMIARYGKPVMISEVGMEVGDPAAANLFLADIIQKNKSLGEGKGLGVFYWEPECHADWKHYTKGAFDRNGRPTVALDAFK